MLSQSSASPRSTNHQGPVLNAGTSLQSLGDTIELCRPKAGDTIPMRAVSSPLRCLKFNKSKQRWNVVGYETGQEYITISYSWPSANWIRLGSSNENSVVTRSGLPTESQHFSRFAAAAVASWLDAAVVVSPSSSVCDLGVWIDHECINQHDKSEKDAQVAVMDSIYIGARCTLILLDDVEMSKDDYAFLVEKRARRGNLEIDRLSSLVRNILGARWFNRAWCSQEVVLSRRAHIFMHCSDEPYGVISFAYSVLAAWVVRAGMNDNSIKALREPRGLSLGSFAQTTVAWTFSTIIGMHCYNEYDKMALVHNLMRAKAETRIVSLPDTEGKGTKQDTLNVCKLLNVWAVEHQDFSLLVSGHLSDDQITRCEGFGWASLPTVPDPIAESWHASKYCVSQDPHALCTPAGLRLRGMVSKIVSCSTWRIWRRESDDKLLVSIDEKAEEIVPTQWWQGGPLHSHQKLQVLRDVLLALAHHNETTMYRSFIHPDEDHKLTATSYSPSDSITDLRRDIVVRFSRATTFISNLAAEMRNAQRPDGKVCLSLIRFAEEDQAMTVFSKTNEATTPGTLLFQPHVIRPNDWGDWLYSVNAMVLEDNPQIIKERANKCVGRVRCFQMFPSDGHDVEMIVS